MAAASKLRYAYLAYLSKPSEDRALYRLAKRLKARKIVELGVGNLAKTLNLISVCQRYSPDAKITYTGFDWFEERPADQQPLALIEAHRSLQAAGASARLMPGGPTTAVPGVANSLLGADLVLISAGVLDEALAPVWFYLPRMLHEGSVVLRGEARGEERICWAELPQAQIESLAGADRKSLAA